MENVTCWAFRKLCPGVTDSFSGMLSGSYLVRRTKAWKEADFFPIEGQRQWLQIASSREAECQELIGRLAREMEAQPDKADLYGIQLNASCPSPNVLRLGQAAALVKRPKKIHALITELLKQDKYKVGIKLRLGLNEFEMKQKVILNAMEALETIQDKNFVGAVVHFKHARSPSIAPYDYSILPELLQYKVPIVINGGFKGYKDFNNLVKTLPNKKNIKGFMMGRQAMVDPDCFVEPSNFINKTELKRRTKEQIKSEFQEAVKLHEPKSIYQEKIAKYCPWMN